MLKKATQDSTQGIGRMYNFRIVEIVYKYLRE